MIFKLKPSAVSHQRSAFDDLRCCRNHVSRFLSLGIFVLLISFGCGQAPKGGLLLDFEREADLDHLFWRCKTWFELSRENPPQGEQWLKAELPPGDFPEVRFKDLPSNWKGLGALSFWAWSPDKRGAKLHLRIDDHRAGQDYQDRFNRIFTLSEKPKRFCTDISSTPSQLPGRKLKRGRIRRLSVFLYHQDTPSTLFLDDFRLLKECSGLRGAPLN